MQTEATPEIRALDLEHGWSSGEQEALPDIADVPGPGIDPADWEFYFAAREHDLVRSVEIALTHEGLPPHYHTDPSAYVRDYFAESGWDEEADALAVAYVRKYMEEMGLQRAQVVTQEVIADLSNDVLESVVAVDRDTGEIVFVRYGDEDSVSLQEELRQLVEGRNIVLIHNHPNNTGASRADLGAANWLDAERLVVATPSGKRYYYHRRGGKLVARKPVQDSSIVAGPDPEETAVARLLHMMQSAMEAGNPAEVVFEQEEPGGWFEFEFEFEDGISIRLDRPKGLSVECARTLATQLWESAQNDYSMNRLWFAEEWKDWMILWQVESAKQRESTYKFVSDELDSSNGIRGDIRFYRAAQNVSFLFSLGEEYSVHRYFNYNRLSAKGYSSGEFDSAMDLLDVIGKDLMAFNRDIILQHFEAASDGDNALMSPLAHGTGALSPPMEVHSGLEWDIHMVWREQAKLGAILDEQGGGIATELEVLTNLITLNYLGDFFRGVADRSDGTASDPVKWVIDELGGAAHLNFDNIQHRRAIGIAMVFQAHFTEPGEAEEKFRAYFEKMPDGPDGLPPAVQM